jgi:hypothetical protein
VTIPPQAGRAPRPSPGSSATRSRAPGQRRQGADQADLWQAYLLAQQHYEVDLQLFSTRMSLFLVIQSALVAFVGGGVRLTGIHIAHPTAVAVFGLMLSASWQVVAVSSYTWVKTWRAKWIEIGNLLHDSTGVDVSARLVDRDRRRDAHHKAYSQRHRMSRQLEALSWLIRPTFISCRLPALFTLG